LHTQAQGKNTELTGCGKMGGLAQFKPETRDRNRVIIAPHHSILTGDYYPHASNKILDYIKQELS